MGRKEIAGCIMKKAVIESRIQAVFMPIHIFVLRLTCYLPFLLNK